MYIAIAYKIFLQRGTVAVIDGVFAEEEPVMYTLRTLKTNKKVEGRLYAREIRRLGKFDQRGKLTVKQIRKKEKRNNVPYSLVQYNELPERKFWTWIKTSDLLKK